LRTCDGNGRRHADTVCTRNQEQAGTVTFDGDGPRDTEAEVKSRLGYVCVGRSTPLLAQGNTSCVKRFTLDPSILWTSSQGPPVHLHLCLGNFLTSVASFPPRLTRPLQILPPTDFIHQCDIYPSGRICAGSASFLHPP